MTTPLREARKRLNFSQVLAQKGWYHSFELPDGTHIDGYQTVDHLRFRWARFPLPEDLRGKRVLDIGAWDGWYSFEAERRGADVVAIDCVEMPNFQLIRQKLQSKVDYRILDFFELPDAGLRPFDCILFLGVLYHLKHPLLALEIVCALTTEIAIVDSFVTDDDMWQQHKDEIPVMEFYETCELAEQLDNWIGPSVTCLMAMCRAAGFARVEFLYAADHHAAVACYRRWEPVPDRSAIAAPELVTAEHSRNYGINFNTRKDEYIMCLFRAAADGFQREDLKLEVGGFGVPCLFLCPAPEGKWQGNFRLPPGLKSGWNEVRLRLSDSANSNALRIAVDMPLRAQGDLRLRGVYGGKDWKLGEITAEDRGHLSCWVAGLGENADRYNVQMYLGGTRLAVEHLGPVESDGFRQVNALVPSDLNGTYPLTIRFADAVSPPSAVNVG